jgi:hypothetical protein
MITISKHAPVITARIFAGPFSILLMQFSLVRKNNRIQRNYQYTLD